MIHCRFANKEEERGKAPYASSGREDTNYMLLYEPQLQRSHSFFGDGREICDAPAQEGPVHKSSWMITATRQAGRAKGVVHNVPALGLGNSVFQVIPVAEGAPCHSSRTTPQQTFWFCLLPQIRVTSAEPFRPRKIIQVSAARGYVVFPHLGTRCGGKVVVVSGIIGDVDVISMDLECPLGVHRRLVSKT